MTVSENPGSEATPIPAAPPVRWPKIVGVVGMVLGAIIFIDKLDDLVMYLTWTEADWERFLGAALTNFVMEAMPPAWFQVVTALFEMGLGALLVVGSLRVWRQRGSGIRLCRVWARIAIVYAVLVMVWVIWWLQSWWGEIPGMPEGSLGVAIYGILLALAIMITYPVFLLIWFSKPDVQAAYGTWPD